MSRYLVTIEGEEYDVVLSQESDGLVATVNGDESRVKSESLGDSRNLLQIDGQVQEVDVRLNSEANQRTVFMRGMEIGASIEDYSIAMLRKVSGVAVATPVQKWLLAPMPGLVRSLEVAVGDTVQIGQAMVIVEAMKMENVVKSEAEGVVKSIVVRVEQAVIKGQKLMEVE